MVRCQTLGHILCILPGLDYMPVASISISPAECRNFALLHNTTLDESAFLMENELALLSSSCLQANHRRDDTRNITLSPYFVYL